MSNWWANRLGHGQTQAGQEVKHTDSRNLPTNRPLESQVQKVQPQVQPQAQPEDLCPGCGSGNYMSPPGTRAQKRCFDCGYPQVQSGTGVGSTKAEGPVKKATQVETGTYSPTTIVGRIE